MILKPGDESAGSSPATQLGNAGISRPWLNAALLIVAVGLGGILVWAARPVARIKLPSTVPDFPASTLAFEKANLGQAGKSAIRTTNVQIVDFDRDRLNDILVCDAARNAVLLYKQLPGGKWEERVLGSDLKCPAHATVADLDGDGDSDLLVAVLGSITPSDEYVGRVVLLQNQGDNRNFSQRVLLDDVRRVADVQAGDLDGDGDLDLTVAVFGYARGEVLWMENLGEGRFCDHQLLFRPGAIHVPIGDLDGDGDLDIATIISQDEEELWVFENLGRGQFKKRRIYDTPNYDVGSAGLLMVDLDRDGDLDLVLPQGDNLEDGYASPQPWHGCVWFENLGKWTFRAKRIASFGATYAAAVGDMDGDHDLDIVLVSLVNDWTGQHQPSIVWLENDGRQNFKPFVIDRSPAGLVTVACGDLNGDGRADIVAGSLNLPPAIERGFERVTFWTSRGGGR